MLAVAVLVAGCFATAPAGAQTTVVDPAGTGASVTIDKDEVAPGERIAISGSGFRVTENVNGGGQPIVAVRPYDFDLGPAWTAGGDDYYAEAPQEILNEAHMWFKTAPEGADPNVVGFHGWIQVPADLTKEGPIGGSLTGQHWLRILSGAFFTSSAGETGRKTGPITFTVPFTLVDNLSTGLTVGPTFHPGSTFRPGASITPRGRGFTPDADVTVRLDDTVIAGTSITTDAEGGFPDSARVVLPASTTPGQHVLRFATGEVAHAIDITVTPPPSATLITPSVRPQGRFAFAFADYIGVAGTGQKVAIVVDEQVLACVQADATGAGSGTAVLPAGIGAGPRTVLFNAGLSCIAPVPGQPPVVNDAPGVSVGASLTVDDAAPTVSVPATATAGTDISVSGEGFPAGQSVEVTLAGAPVASTLTTDAQGRFSGSLTLPAAAADGVLRFTVAATSAVAVISITEPGPDVPGPGAGAGGAGGGGGGGGGALGSGGGGATDAVTPPSVIAEPPALTTASSPSTPAPTASIAAIRVTRATLAPKRLTLRLAPRAIAGTAITVRTRTKVRTAPKQRPRIVTLAKAKLQGGASVVRLRLTGAGRALVRRHAATRVVVRVAPPTGPATTKRLTLRTGRRG